MVKKNGPVIYKVFRLVQFSCYNFGKITRKISLMVYMLKFDNLYALEKKNSLMDNRCELTNNLSGLVQLETLILFINIQAERILCLRQML